MSDINTQMSGSGNNGDTKNFRQKNWRSFDGEVNITWKEGFPFADIDWDSYYLDTGESGIMEEDWWEEY